jgi:mRNA-degrading endonuclease YafQ of YafQ-DinJ toxin-antitoxin module
MRLEETARFARRRRRLSDSDARALTIALARLAANPRDPTLRTHKLQGSERWACSYAYDGRVIFLWEREVIYLLDVGSHDQVY